MVWSENPEIRTQPNKENVISFSVTGLDSDKWDKIHWWKWNADV